MELTNLINLTFRVLLILFSATILGLSVVLNNNNTEEISRCDYYHNCGTLPDYIRPMTAAFRFCIFVGAFGLLDACVGVVVVTFMSGLWMVAAGLDGLAGVFYVAGGARLAAFLAKPYACEAVSSFPGLGDQCTKLKADAAFLFLGFIGVVVTIVLGVVGGRRGGRGASFV